MDVEVCASAKDEPEASGEALPSDEDPVASSIASESDPGE